MFSVPKKFSERVLKTLPKFQKVLALAKDRDVNEADTVSIVKDILGELFGYDKFLEVTSELAIRGTYCDLAIKVNDQIQFLIECKAIGLAMKESHLKQAIDYGANKGIPWVVLTNGMLWSLYRLRFEQPISYDPVFSLNLAEVSPRSEKDIELLYILSKEGLEKAAREEYYNKIQSINRFIIGNLILSETVISSLRKEIRKFAGDIRVDAAEIEAMLKMDIIKREIIDGEEAKAAQERLRKYYKKIERLARKKDISTDETTPILSEKQEKDSNQSS
ncbi:MAG: type I restriction enzyme HsdR N-terminal domain-containing protein [Candidatus Latescibacter sp.]|nr:type I restriction enzyme HsdR N-terminal domain-containing protein [Candidatus Latescibacter sp.]